MSYNALEDTSVIITRLVFRQSVGFVFLMGIQENRGKSIESQPHALIRHLRRFVFIHAFIALR